MHLFSHPNTKDPRDQSDEPAIVALRAPSHNTSEGSEFLDDAIRMEDLPIIHIEESIAAGSPANLL